MVLQWFLSNYIHPLHSQWNGHELLITQILDVGYNLPANRFSDIKTGRSHTEIEAENTK